VRVKCPGCQKVGRIPDGIRSAKCPGCGTVFQPETAEIADTPAAAPPVEEAEAVEEAEVAPPSAEPKPTKKRKKKGKGPPPATEKQIDYLRTLGWDGDPDELNVRTASDAIEEFKMKRQCTSGTPATVKQITEIARLDGTPWEGISADEASNIIDILQNLKDEMEDFDAAAEEEMDEGWTAEASGAMAKRAGLLANMMAGKGRVEVQAGGYGSAVFAEAPGEWNHAFQHDTIDDATFKAMMKPMSAFIRAEGFWEGIMSCAFPRADWERESAAERLLDALEAARWMVDDT